jgi:hypothetical protein
MSHFDRNIDYLIKHKIIYRQDPKTDIPSETYEWGYFYKDGTYQCYTLFNTKAKINTFKSLKWHLYVLWYLNPKLDQEGFEMLVKYICDINNGFVTFSISDQLRNSMVYDVSMMDLEKPPPNKLRKVIFKDFTGLTTSQKLSIVGQLVGRSKISNNEIYEAMLLLNEDNVKITISALAEFLLCSTRTIYRNINNELKKEKELLNSQINK